MILGVRKLELKKIAAVYGRVNVVLAAVFDSYINIKYLITNQQFHKVI